MSYNIVPPSYIISVLLFGGIDILVLSIILSVIAIKRGENGKLKYFTLWFIPLVVVIVTIVPIILMAAFGFNEPNETIGVITVGAKTIGLTKTLLFPALVSSLFALVAIEFIVYTEQENKLQNKLDV